MKFLRKFNDHTFYEAEVNEGGRDFKIPNVSYCKDVDDVHFNPYNLIEFYVGEITGTTPQTVKIYTGDSSTSIDVTVSEGNKWYSYVLPKDKGLSKIEGISIKKVVVKADISYDVFSPILATDKHIIPSSTVEASFKGSNTSNINNMFAMFADYSDLTSLDVSNFDTSNVTNMGGIFGYCTSLKSLDLSNFDTSKVTNMGAMFKNCSGLTFLDLSNFDTSNVTYTDNMFINCSKLNTIRMVGCSSTTIDKIKAQLKKDGLSEDIVKTT